MVENFEIEKTFSFNVNVGLNKILFEPENFYPVKKGQMVFINTTISNQIAVYKTINSKPSYYFFSQSAKLARLGFNFHFNVLIDTSYYFFEKNFVIPFNKNFNIIITAKIGDVFLNKKINISKSNLLIDN